MRACALLGLSVLALACSRKPAPSDEHSEAAGAASASVQTAPSTPAPEPAQAQAKPSAPEPASDEGEEELVELGEPPPSGVGLLMLPTAEPPRPRTPAEGGAREVPGGPYAAGSMPGESGRDSSNEPALAVMEMHAFRIDALPLPGEPGQPPQQLSQSEAVAACAARGARLCSEWEWERACRGPALDAYASGANWDSECEREPASCASGYGVRAMGGVREWTQQGAVRGGKRCAHRGTGEGVTRAVARCCHGEANTAKPPAAVEHPAFRSVRMEDAELAALIAQFPALSGIGEGVRFWSANESSAAYVRSSTSREGIKFASQPVLWSPERGVEILVLAGRSKRHGFVLAMYPLGDGRYKLASTMIFAGDTTPVVLAYRASSRREFLWTAHWGSRTDEGYISWREDKRVVIVQK